MHIKYRPKNWDEVIGNKAVVKVLRSKNDSRPILFYGDRGCGKTTMAYIVANQFGADSEEVKIVDCVEHSGIEEMRDRLSSLRRSSLFSNKKVLILDEVHGLSPKALSLFLVPLDGEGNSRLPDNILVLACTSKPEKLPSEMFDRFLTFKVNSLSEEDSLKLINYVSEKENIKLQKWIKVLLINKLEGNPRRLLTGLVKVKNLETEEEVNEILDLVSIDEDPDILELFKLYGAGKFLSSKNSLADLLKSKSPSSIRVGLMNIISGYLISKFNDGDSNTPRQERVLKLYKYLQEAEGFPEKANLIYAIMRK